MSNSEEETPGFYEANSNSLKPEKQSKKPDVPHFAGHRQRLRQRFINSNPDTMSDYELLELVLFRSLPRRDVKPLAKSLIAEFGSFAEVISAPFARLKSFPGLGESSAIDIKITYTASHRLARGRIANRTLLDNWPDVIDYCRTMIGFENRERFHVLFMDKRNKLIADELQQVGTVDHTPVYPREVARRAIELSACAIILVHNHPSGDPKPSQNDISMTRQIVETVRTLNIKVHDHIIVGKQGHFSFQGAGLL